MTRLLLTATTLMALSGPAFAGDCTSSAGGSILGFGASLPTTDDRCEKRQLAELDIHSQNPHLRALGEAALEQLTLEEFPNLNHTPPAEGRKPVPGKKY